jgi:hypothetical protein
MRWTVRALALAALALCCAGHTPVLAQNAACTPFSAFPLSLNLGAAPTGLGGVSVRCANQTLQTAVNRLAASAPMVDAQGNLVVSGGPALAQLQAGAWQLLGDGSSLSVAGAPLSSVISRSGGKTTLTPDAVTGDTSASSVTLRGVQRPLSVKLSELPTIQDFVDPADSGDYAPAIERAKAKGVAAVRFPSGTLYTLKRPFNLPDCSISLIADKNNKVEMRLIGSNDYFGTVGQIGSMCYDFEMSGFLFTKESQSSQGGVLRITNAYRWYFNDNYIYGEDKIWRGVECFSCAAGKSVNVQVERVRQRAFYASGGTPSAGAPGGRVIDNWLDNWNIRTGNNVSSDPANDGVLFFEDNFEANWVTNIKADHFKGYLIYFKGTAGNIANNGLNLVLQPNAEASYTGSGGVRFGAVRGSQIGGPASWLSSWGLPAIRIDAASFNNIVRDLQITATGAVDAIQDFGRYNTIQDMEVDDYQQGSDGRTDAAVVLGSGVVGSKLQRITANATNSAIRLDDTSGNAGVIVQDIDYYALRGPDPIPGLHGAGINVVRNVVARGSQGPTPYFSAAASVSMPLGKGQYFCSTAGSIDQFTPGYLGEERVIAPQSGTVTLRDINTTGVANGAGGIVTKSRGSSNYTGVQNLITIRWMGDYWYER